MKPAQSLALAALLSTPALAFPHVHEHRPGHADHARLHQKREVVTTTTWEVVTQVVTITVTSGDPGVAPASSTVAPAAPAAPAAAPSITNSPLNNAIQPGPAPAAPPPAPVDTSTSSSSSAPPAPAPSPTDSPAPAAPTGATNPPTVPVASSTSSSSVLASSDAPTSTSNSPAPGQTVAPWADFCQTCDQNKDLRNIQCPPGGPFATSALGPSGQFAGIATIDIDSGWTACGTQFNPSNHTVAVPEHLFTAANPNNDPMCNRQVSITGCKGTFTAMVADKCPGCSGNHLDLAGDLYYLVTGTTSRDVYPISWQFLS